MYIVKNNAGNSKHITNTFEKFIPERVTSYQIEAAKKLYINHIQWEIYFIFP